ncbi:hypothetical protein IMZ48_26820 [Candidatus Bathyarchaeota archaeon]|nr:hypothetical protein [Candidatus Bathyarchaeota archaeon]
MKIPSLFTLASLAVIAQAATNEPCVGEGGAAGKFPGSPNTPLSNTKYLIPFHSSFRHLTLPKVSASQPPPAPKRAAPP